MVSHVFWYFVICLYLGNFELLLNITGYDESKNVLQNSWNMRVWLNPADFFLRIL
jgi:hypothetical protein